MEIQRINAEQTLPLRQQVYGQAKALSFARLMKMKLAIITGVM